MKKLNIFLILFLVIAFSSHAAIELKWSAKAGETKRIDEIVTNNGYTVDWGAGGELGTKLYYKYEAAGEYTALVYGEITSFKLTDGSNSGVTSIRITEEDEFLETLLIWTNPSLSDLDIRNAKALKRLDMTLLSIELLDISKNLSLQTLDMKMATIGDIKTAREHSSLSMLDVNNSKIDACVLNKIYRSLPDLTQSEESGTIYSVACTGDATSDSDIAKNKGWAFGNGGLGNGTAICYDVPILEVPTDIHTENIAGTDKYIVSWTASGDEEFYSVRVYTKNQSLCGDEFYFTDSPSVEIGEIDDPDNYMFVVYAVADTYFAKSKAYDFLGNATSIATVTDSNEFVYAQSGKIVVKNSEQGSVVSLYKINGMLMGSKIYRSDSVEFDVEPNTIYIIKTKHRAYKLIATN